jgi:class 3 adenylate cyclase/HAMP domain-containing protein
MSFKLKTILLLIFLSLAPYLVTTIYLGNAYHNDFEKRIRDDMGYQLDVTIDRLDQHIRNLQKDLRFIASLDIMNDILTGDLDKRISNLLLLKKQDLQLIGNFEIVDSDLIIVASSDINRIGITSSSEGFMSIPVYSTFDQSQIGTFILRYDLDNLTRFFANEKHLQYSLQVENEVVSSQSSFKDKLVVQKTLETRPEISVVLEQNKDFAFSILDDFTRSFYVTLIFGVFIIAAIAFLIANYIVNPILLLSETAKSITKTQDYSQQVEVNRGDEIGQLATAFNLMISGIQGMIEKLKEESENKLKLTQETSRAEMLQSLSTKLSKYLSPQIYDSIFSSEKDATLSSSRKKLTVFFSDIVNFTGTTDQMESEDLTLLLNQYLNEMTNIALQHGATVDKYIGDAVMIFFGDPHSDGVVEDANKCLGMAIDMQKRVKELQHEWRAAGYSKPFSLRIGIHTGYCTVGNFGSENRMSYTIVGSTVNLASRIESAAKPDTIFISEDTFLLVKDNFNCKSETAVTPKGFSQPVQLYSVEFENKPEQSINIDHDGFKLKFYPEKLSTLEKENLKNELKNLVKEL